MSFRARFNQYIRRVKDWLRSLVTDEPIALFPVQTTPPTSGVGQQPSSSHPPATGPDPGPASAVPTTAIQSNRASDWAGLRAFLRVLNQSAGVFGPLKAVVDELVVCIGIYEVRVLV
jgi:hypothetical protein